MTVYILTADRPHKLTLTLQSLLYNMPVDVYIIDNGEVPAQEDEDVRNMIDLLSLYKERVVTCKRVVKQGLPQLRWEHIFSVVGDKKFFLLDDDIILEEGVLEKLSVTMENRRCAYVVAVCMDITNLLEHSDFTRKVITLGDGIMLSDGLKRHRLYDMDEEMAIQYSDLSTVLIDGSRIRQIDKDKYMSCKLWTDGIAFTKLLGTGYLRTGAVTYHNTSRSWFKDWRKKLDKNKEEELKRLC